MTSQDMNLVSTSPVEWASDDIRGFFGYSVHINNGVWPEHVGFPAFTHEQMLECKRIIETLGKRYGFDVYPRLEFDGKTWSEVYDEDEETANVADTLQPFEVDGVELYALGSYTDWPWGLISDNFEYQVI